MENSNKEKYPARLKTFLESLNQYTDNSDRINLLIDYAEKFVPVPETIAVKPYAPENKIEYCESGAYAWTIKQPDNTFKFYFDIENPYGISAKATAKILDDTLSGETAENILKVPDDIIYQIFGQSLSMGKNLGLIGLILAIKIDVRKLMNEKENAATDLAKV